MSASSTYTLITVVVLLVIVVVAFILGRREPHNNLTPLGGLALGFIIAGILFGANQVVGYSFLGLGVLLVVIDIIRRRQ